MKAVLLIGVLFSCVRPVNVNIVTRTIREVVRDDNVTVLELIHMDGLVLNKSEIMATDELLTQRTWFAAIVLMRQPTQSEVVFITGT